MNELSLKFHDSWNDTISLSVDKVINLQTAERISAQEPSDWVIYQRSLFAYEQAVEFAEGNVLEIGCGEGYGIKVLSEYCESYFAMDKFKPPIIKQLGSPHIVFLQQVVPPILNFNDLSLDRVFMFQLLEHIADDKALIDEVFRVLKPGGKLILTTPNSQKSLTRNPWHVREYTASELEEFLCRKFENVEILGVSGNSKLEDYYYSNLESVKKIKRFDVFDFENRLPRKVLQLPYDLLNRINRKILASTNSNLISDISTGDFRLTSYVEKSYDLFAIAMKPE